MTTWATRRLDELIAGAEPPPVIRTMRLGTLDAWGDGYAKKRWEPTADMLNSDGSMFGGLIAALADQMLAFAAMTVVPEDKIFRTINLSLTFHHISRTDSVDIEAVVVAQSQQLIGVRAYFRSSEGKLLAEASAQQIVRGFG